MPELATATTYERPKLDFWTEHTALFYGAHANYTRMRGLVGLILKNELPVTLVNTGQHWDPNFIGDGFGPDANPINLDTRTSDVDVIRDAAKKYLRETRCDVAIVYGDTASALGPALAAKDLHIRLVHLEGGFRTYDSAGRRIDSSLPEEGIRNRIDRMADLIVPLVPSAGRALREERDRILMNSAITRATGHPLADGIIKNRAQFESVKPNDNFGILTIHRKANLEGGKDSGLAQVLDQVASMPHIKWAFPKYPATQKLIESADLRIPPNVFDIPPLDHAAILDRVKSAGVIVSDSAGLQVEVGLAPRRMVIPRDETEYPDLLGESVIMTKPYDVRDGVERVLSAPLPSGERLDEMHAAFGNGHAADNLYRHVGHFTLVGGVIAAPYLPDPLFRPPGYSRW